jgi:hypothetical protein
MSVMMNRLWTAAAVAGVLAATGCGDPSAKVVGRVTCQGKPVVGLIQFSPKVTGATSAPALSTDLDDDGRYEIQLASIGPHTVVVTPRDVVFRPKAGAFDYPCDRSPIEREIKAGDNDVTIEMAKRTK